ncbi:MAG TPA: N-acetylmuramoyl-L-alanine amidase [Polyangiaceae bacterium]|nr:N-acetylmuramoyl-L-alanine amidase [Polyangiaceae bacterium]
MKELTRTSLALPGALALAMALGGCGGSGASGSDGGAAATLASDLPRARAIAEGRAELPPRPVALAFAESIEAQALREGAGARAATLHATAARLVERVWRIDGRDRDAREAIEMYGAAASDPTAPGACEAALAAARLAGDSAHDAAVTYAQLYRVQRRFASAGAGELTDGGIPCPGEVEVALSQLAAFRPPQRVLDAIDVGLAGEGMLARAPEGPMAAMAPATNAKPPQILRVESWPGRDAARVVVVLDRPAPYRIGDEALAGGTSARTFLDLDGVDVGGTPRLTAVEGIVSRVQTEATSTGSRISLDVDGRAWRRAFAMHDPYRIVIDVAHHPPGAPTRARRAIARMALDPGHGGKDTGAVGPGGLKEKDVTLDVARRAAAILDGQGIDVVLTREDDHFVPLEERTARANAFGADLFVSIHCNASEIKTRRGVEAYVLDTSRDEIAARVAARENATTQAASADLTAILGDLRLADQSRHSVRFARLLGRAASSALGARYGDAIDGGVHTAGFYVLVGADMPSVLFETSYISNVTEEQRLGTDEYRQVLADAIANAVKAYREGR